MNKQSLQKARSKYREYYEENKYLGGLITTTIITDIEKLGDEIHLKFPEDKYHNLKIFINGQEYIANYLEKNNERT